MSGTRLPRHGRNHLPGGSDEIPQLASGVPPNQFFPLLTSAESGMYGTWTSQEYDSSLFGGGSLRNTGAEVDGSFFVFHCVLGPTGSVWVVDAVFETGPDYGIVAFYIASVDEDSVSTPTQKGVMQDPSTCDYIAFAIGSQDCYDSTPTSDVLVAGVAAFRVMGSPSAPLTAIATDAYTGQPAGDGGPGLYNLKGIIQGKNGSSSGYKGGVQSLTLRRIAEGFD